MGKFNIRTSVKHLQIDKANKTILIAAVVTTSVVVFSLVAVRTLYTQMKYQNKVISLRNKANKQLEKNIKETVTLVTAYKTFEDSSESVIGTADKNSKIVLDALPSKYDFPALATSLEKVILDSKAKIQSITGTDDEVGAKQDSPDPKPVEVPFTISASGAMASIQTLITNLEKSIRPIKVNTLSLSGSDANMQATIQATTYYQPEKKLDVQQTIITNGNITVKKTTSRVNGATK